MENVTESCHLFHKVTRQLEKQVPRNNLKQINVLIFIMPSSFEALLQNRVDDETLKNNLDSSSSSKQASIITVNSSLWNTPKQSSSDWTLYDTGVPQSPRAFDSQLHMLPVLVLESLSKPPSSTNIKNTFSISCPKETKTLKRRSKKSDLCLRKVFDFKSNLPIGTALEQYLDDTFGLLSKLEKQKVKVLRIDIARFNYLLQKHAKHSTCNVNQLAQQFAQEPDIKTFLSFVSSL
ncbi:uncharacterized protein LOC142336841 [Convolutriloba macropyga]|uniref:uncharacterized protein LOC142336841 n=1 Tax=Convolutriloba macropyga TaxID=536237 RepID=UPI003F5262F5